MSTRQRSDRGSAIVEFHFLGISNAKKYRNSEATTETYEFPDRSHFTGVGPGWEQVADYALEWATSHARTQQG